MFKKIFWGTIVVKYKLPADFSVSFEYLTSNQYCLKSVSMNLHKLKETYIAKLVEIVSRYAWAV